MRIARSIVLYAQADISALPAFILGFSGMFCQSAANAPASLANFPHSLYNKLGRLVPPWAEYRFQ